MDGKLIQKIRKAFSIEPLLKDDGQVANPKDCAEVVEEGEIVSYSDGPLMWIVSQTMIYNLQHPEWPATLGGLPDLISDLNVDRYFPEEHYESLEKQAACLGRTDNAVREFDKKISVQRRLAYSDFTKMQCEAIGMFLEAVRSRNGIEFFRLNRDAAIKYWKSRSIGADGNGDVPKFS